MQTDNFISSYAKETYVVNVQSAPQDAMRRREGENRRAGAGRRKKNNRAAS